MTNNMNKKKHVKIIAEIGVNHNGSFDTAMEMIRTAKKCGVDCVKFQIAKPELSISKYADKAKYQINNTGNTESQLEMCKSFELPFEYFAEFKKECERLNLEFLATPFDLAGIDYLESIGVDSYKIPSGEVTNLPYLEKIAKLHKPIILSTGMCSMDDVGITIDILKKNGAVDITILHCTTEYPAPYNEVNLLAMNSLKDKFGYPIGYSDHTMGIEVSIAAVALGAMVVEKHFTLDRKLKGPDHIASIEPNELERMVKAIRNIEMSLGTAEKKASKSEEETIKIARKSIVAKKDIMLGEIYTEENLAIKRPGTGISPLEWYNLLGKRAKRNYKEDELIER